MYPATLAIIIIFLATFGVFVFSFFSFCRIQKHRHYKCLRCGYRYKPGCAEAFFARRENVTDRLLACPRCGNRGFFENIEDSMTGAEEDRGENDGPGGV